MSRVWHDHLGVVARHALTRTVLKDRLLTEVPSRCMGAGRCRPRTNVSTISRRLDTGASTLHGITHFLGA